MGRCGLVAISVYSPVLLDTFAWPVILSSWRSAIPDVWYGVFVLHIAYIHVCVFWRYYVCLLFCRFFMPRSFTSVVVPLSHFLCLVVFFVFWSVVCLCVVYFWVQYIMLWCWYVRYRRMSGLLLRCVLFFLLFDLHPPCSHLIPHSPLLRSYPALIWPTGYLSFRFLLVLPPL